LNKFTATVKEIQSNNSLNIVSFDFNGLELSMMSLDLDSSIHIGSKVKLGVKSTSIAVAKEFNGVISYSNQLNAVVKTLDDGKLLSSINAEVNSSLFEAIITSKSVNRMNVKVGDSVTLFIKASELFIVEVCND